MCKFEYVDGEHVIFLEDEATADCPYRKTFGTRQLCRCPTHYAILKELERKMEVTYTSLAEAATKAATKAAKSE